MTAAKPPRRLTGRICSWARTGSRSAFSRPRWGGKPIGVPGIVRLMEGVHKDYGKLPWPKLFEPAIKLAEDGFAVTPRLHWWLDTAKDFLASSPDLKARYYKPDGSALDVGDILKSPELAKTLHLLADKGPNAFYTGP